jgi:5-methylcytosine-specific restriction endonuclease McrA
MGSFDQIKTSKGAIVKMSTLCVSQKTHPEMLPQSLALESASADNPGVGTKRGAEATSSSVAAGMQHDQGERRVSGRHQGNLDRGRKPMRSPQQGSRPVAARVFVLDRRGKPMMPCHPARAKKLLRKGRARVHKMVPFTIRLIDRSVQDSVVQPVLLLVDPGSKFTGIAVARTEQAEAGEVRHGLFGVEVQHRGHKIRDALTARAQLRRGRRSRNLRYRAPRFLNRHPAPCIGCGRNSQHSKNWCRPCQADPAVLPCQPNRPVRLAPSLRHRVENTLTWIGRLRRLAPVTGLVQELVRFDMQQMTNPDITGVQYQQGTLVGFEVKEYLLAKWGRTCVYCSVTNVPLNIDHLHPRSRGGSDAIWNLTLACIPCNQRKGSQLLAVFLAKKPALLKRLLVQAKLPLRDAAAVNTTRWVLRTALAFTGLPVATGSGGLTKFNRHRNHLPKSHTLDALAVGTVGRIACHPNRIVVAQSMGRGSYQRTATDKYGFPTRTFTKIKRHFGFATGDQVTANVPTGKYAGRHRGRAMVRATGYIDIRRTDGGLTQGIPHRYLTLAAKADGWQYRTLLDPAPALPNKSSATTAA